MTIYVVLLNIVYGTISGIIGTYIVRLIDKIHKNNRHS